MDVILTCPLGSECEEIKDNKLYRCRWYKQLAGKDPQSTKQIELWDCAIAWQPLLSVEMSGTNRGQTAALESFRNEMVKGQDEFNTLIEKSINGKSKSIGFRSEQS